MLRRRTTFVIGAGSSCELGLPSGERLKSHITQILQPTPHNFYQFSDDRLLRAFQAVLQPITEEDRIMMARFASAGAKIRSGLPMALSIDNFLHTHQGDGDVVALGKLAITIAILQAERASLLFKPEDTQPTVASTSIDPLYGASLHDESWFPKLAGLLFSQVSADDPVKAFDGVTFIVFNYDRCLEQFLWLAARAYFGMSEGEAADLLATVRFIHPYGTVGQLPWQNETGAGVLFGSDQFADIWAASAQLKTFTESVDSELSGQITEAVTTAGDLALLGFGYLDQNVTLLRAGVACQAGRVFTTAYGLAPPDQDMVYNALSSIVGMSLGAWNDRSRSGTPAYLETGTCRDLLTHHHLQLTLA